MNPPRSVKDFEKAEVIDIWNREWSDLPEGYFQRYFYGDHHYIPDYTRVIEDNGQIVCTAQVVKRIVQCGDAVLTLGGITNVWTRSDYRRRGYTTAIVSNALDLIKADAMDIAIMPTGLRPFKNLGFELLALSSASFLRNESVFPNGFEICDPKGSDYPSIYAIHREFNHKRPLAVERSEEYWRDWILKPHKDTIRIQMAKQDHEICGYAVYHDSNDGIEVCEFGCKSCCPEVIGALLSEIPCGQQVKIPNFMAPAIAEPVLSLFGPPKSITDLQFFVKFTNLSNTLFGLMPEMMASWMAAGSPDGELKLDYGESMLIVKPQNGFLRIEESSVSGMSWSGRQLLRAILGKIGPAPAQFGGIEFLASLFPERQGTFWALDMI